MAGDAEVKLYLDHVRVVIGHATERGMAAAAGTLWRTGLFPDCCSRCAWI